MASSLASHGETGLPCSLETPYKACLSPPTNSAESCCFPTAWYVYHGCKRWPKQCSSVINWWELDCAIKSKNLSRIPCHAKQTYRPCNKSIARQSEPNSCSRHSPMKRPRWPTSFRQASCNGLSQWWFLQCRRSDSNKDQLRQAASNQFQKRLVQLLIN